MSDVDEAVAFCNDVLDAEDWPDLGPNGLQVPGTNLALGTVVSTVTAHREAIERAVTLGADLVLAHHGLLWDFHPRRITAQLAGRLRPLFVSGAALAGYHLPLDAHPEIGNNALLAAAIGGAVAEPFAPVLGRPIGRVARFAGDGIAIGELLARVREACGGREPLAFTRGGPERVRSVGVVTGAAAKSLPDAIALGLDAFLTGEPAEHVMGDAHEAGIHFIAAGHYATETFGIRRLGALVAAEFGATHHFVDLPNPV